MFGARKVAKAQTACADALRQFVARPSFLGPWPEKFWHDPFVMGFIVGVVGLVAEWSTNGKLNTEQRGRVLMGTMQAIGRDPIELTNRVANLTLRQKVDYQQGLLNAQKVISFILALSPMPNDPDVRAATELARGSSLSGSVGHDEIGGELMHLMFHQVVRARLGA